MSPDDRIGTEFAGFRIEGLIGRGGMGVVYLAEQVRYGRKVALKVLAPELSHDPGFRERFEQEWRVAAQMEHPNIVPIYEAGEAEGVLYIAMRYVQGVDLGALLAKEGRLDTRRTITVLAQIAAALDAANAKGLVHRDVKPGNILVSSDAGVEGDHVYLTDFGIAKRARSAAHLTRTGFFVGTIDYSSPEQIEGREIDGRADQYALACVMYQCLTGVLPFEKDSEVAMLYAHLLEQPTSVVEKRPDLPEALDPVLAKALEKKPDDRYATCREFITAARRAAGVTPEALHPPPVLPPTVADSARTVVDSPATVPEPAPGLATPTPPPPQSAPPQFGSPSAPPPPPRRSGFGGKRLAAIVAALVLIGGGVGAALALSGGGGGGETGAGETTGPEPPTTGTDTTGNGGTTGDSGVVGGTGELVAAGSPALVFASQRDGDYDIYAMRLDGGNRVRLTNDPGIDGGPRWSPDGTKIAFYSDRDGDYDIFVMNADGTGVRKLTTNKLDEYDPAWSPDGQHLVFERDDEDGNRDLWVMSASGENEVQLTTDPGVDQYPDWSPDGSTIVFASNRTGNYDLFVMNADGTGQEALTETTRNEDTPAWSPDGSEIVFTTDNADSELLEIWRMGADGSDPQLVSDQNDFLPRWTPDGPGIVFQSTRDGDAWDIYTMDADGSNVSRLTDDFTNDFEPDATAAAELPAPGSEAAFLQDADRFPTRREAALLAHVDPKLRPSCIRETRDQVAGKAIAGIVCSDGEFTVYYDQFATPAAMREYYSRWVTTDRNQGNCETDMDAEGTWERDGEVKGRRVCYENTDENVRVIVWTHDNLNTVGFASRDPLDRAAMFKWWNSPRAQLVE